MSPERTQPQPASGYVIVKQKKPLYRGEKVRPPASMWPSQQDPQERPDRGSSSERYEKGQLRILDGEKLLFGNGAKLDILMYVGNSEFI